MAQTTPTRPTSPHRRPRRGRRSGIAGTGGGRRNTGTGGPGGEARPSPGSSPPGTPDLRRGVDATVTTGPISDALERLQAEHRELSALLSRSSRVLPRVEAMLRKHARLEEEIFYPALRSAAGRDFEPVLSEAMRQHRAIGAARCSSSGRYGASPMMRANSPCTFRVSASTSGVSTSTSGRRRARSSRRPCGG